MIGISIFESDSASTFLTDLFTTGYGLLEVALDNVLDDDHPAGVVACEEALISAEIIAAAIGNPAFDLPEDAREWIADNLPLGSDEHQQVTGWSEKAADVIDRVLTESELKEMWDGNAGYDDWFGNLIELQKRLIADGE